ncbi:ABC transporter ATP-binding protein [Hydrogenophaga sp.]|uniref:ABC transporter ATP-binding protein n=2 Tax=Hydrogenophaga sp. TaxID=1904254 RepID=UPI0040374753
MLLELSGLCKSYGKMTVIRDLDLAVQEGEFVGVIGPNGAGKTTLFGLVAGHLSCSAGRIALSGRDVTHQRAEQRCHAGIGRTFQIPQPFQSLTVFENVLVAATFGAGLRFEQASAQAVRALKRCGLHAAGDTPAASLSLLQRKRLELARALATEPKLLLLDEVAGGLTDKEMNELVALVQDLHREGTTILWIEHLVHALVPVAQRLVVLTDGTLLADGVPSDVITNQRVRETYLGAELKFEEARPGASHAAH